MKLILGVFVFGMVLVIAMAAPTDKELRKMFENFVSECQKNTSSSALDILQYTKDKVPDSKEGKCFVGCMFEKMGLIINGSFSKTAADKMAYEDFPNDQAKINAAKKIFELCDKEMGSAKGRCVSGPKLLECIEKYDKKPNATTVKPKN